MSIYEDFKYEYEIIIRPTCQTMRAVVNSVLEKVLLQFDSDAFLWNEDFMDEEGSWVGVCNGDENRSLYSLEVFWEYNEEIKEISFHRALLYFDDCLSVDVYFHEKSIFEICEAENSIIDDLVEVVAYGNDDLANGLCPLGEQHPDYSIRKIK